MLCVIFFFFSSRRRHTRCGRDWSSDVCSSDLRGDGVLREGAAAVPGDDVRPGGAGEDRPAAGPPGAAVGFRSEERRVGKECRSGRSGYQEKKKKKERGMKDDAGKIKIRRRNCD